MRTGPLSSGLSVPIRPPAASLPRTVVAARQSIIMPPLMRPTSPPALAPVILYW